MPSEARLLRVSLSGMRKNKVLRALLLICLIGIVACSTFSLSHERKRELQPKLVQFHVSLISQRVSPVLQYFPAEERPKWNSAFDCLHQEYRYLDYRIEEIQFGVEAKEATVFVKMIGHHLDSLSSEEFIWEERWEAKDKSWVLDATPELIQSILGECYPGPDGKKSHDNSKTDL